jgi:DNA-binding beta-propeller fold protein YncE
MKKQILSSLACILFISACTKPKKETKDETPIEPTLNEKVIIANEGGFTKGNAEISYINPNTNEINNDLFAKANNNGILGDVLQSISFKGDYMYCILNNSGNIKILDKNTFMLNTTITNLNSPRFMSFVNNNTALVSSLSFSAGNNPMSFINTNTNTKGNTLNMVGWSEGLLTLANSTYICNYSKAILYKLNNTTLQIIDSVKLDAGCKEVVAYKNGQLLVLTEGDFNLPSSVSKIYQIDTTSLTKLDSIGLGASGYSNVNFSISENIITVLGGNKIRKLNLALKSNEPIISGAAGESFYGFGFDEKYKKYYVCDAKDYQQKGQVIIYDKSGNKIISLTAGIIPSKVYFNY